MSKKIILGCEHGHEKHERKWVSVDGFDLLVFDYTKYEHLDKYCPGRDDFSKSIIINKSWEDIETLTMKHILSNAETPTMLDFGCNVGFFSIIAAQLGANVLATDGIQEHLDMLMLSAKKNGVDNLIHCNHQTIDATTKGRIKVDNITYLKSDVEGAEEHVINACWPLFENRTVEYAMLEISPCFNDSYPALVKRILNQGYSVMRMPSKEEYGPWYDEGLKTGTGLDSLYLTEGQALERLAEINQENWIFTRS